MLSCSVFCLNLMKNVIFVYAVNPTWLDMGPLSVGFGFSISAVLKAFLELFKSFLDVFHFVVSQGPQNDLSLM